MSRLTRRLSVAACAVVVMLSLSGCVFNIGHIFSSADESDQGETAPRPIGALSWASEGVSTVVDDNADMAERMRKLQEALKETGIEIEYKNEAYSRDGVNFECYIGNPIKSAFPLFITIYADNTFQEELFVSGLIKPGQAFNRVVMSRALEYGTSVLPICYTQVYEPHTGPNETDDFTIRAQTIVTINFNVVDENFVWDLSGE